MAITLPHIFEDGPTHLASGVQVMDNLNALKAAIEGVSAAASQADAFQSGVLASADWHQTLPTVNAGTGNLTQKGVGGNAWLPAPSGGLVRTFTPSREFANMVPPAKPAPGGFMCIGEEIYANGSEALLALVCGPEKGSEAEAMAASPATTAGRVRIHDTPLKNVGGVYSNGTFDRDRRPWARGAYWQHTFVSSTKTNVAGKAAVDAATMKIRLECSGVPLQIGFGGNISKYKAAKLGVSVSPAGGNVKEYNTGKEEESEVMTVEVVTPYEARFGSVLFELYFEGPITVANYFMWIREMLPSQSNGGE